MTYIKQEKSPVTLDSGAPKGSHSVEGSMGQIGDVPALEIAPYPAWAACGQALLTRL